MCRTLKTNGWSMYFWPKTNFDPTSVKAKRTCAGTYSVVWGDNKEMTDWKQVANKTKPNKAVIMYHGCTSTLWAINCSAEEPDGVLKISRAMMNCSKVPEIKTRQGHCKRHLAVSVFVCEAERVGRWVVGACLTWNGCLENRSIKKTKRSKPKKDTICLVPRLAVSRANHKTASTSRDAYRTLERSNRKDNDSRPHNRTVPK